MRSNKGNVWWGGRICFWLVFFDRRGRLSIEIFGWGGCRVYELERFSIGRGGYKYGFWYGYVSIILSINGRNLELM